MTMFHPSFWCLFHHVATNIVRSSSTNKLLEQWWKRLPAEQRCSDMSTSLLQHCSTNTAVILNIYLNIQSSLTTVFLVLIRAVRLKPMQWCFTNNRLHSIRRKQTGIRKNWIVRTDAIKLIVIFPTVVYMLKKQYNCIYIESKIDEDTLSFKDVEFNLGYALLRAIFGWFKSPLFSK